MQKETLVQLASEKSDPSVTISLNTHRTRPDNAKDKLVLKNLTKEAEDRLLKEFSKREIDPLLKKLSQITDEIDISRNLESMHVFLSNHTKEIIRSTWPAQKDAVYISDSFFLRPLIKAYNRSEEYYILLVSQGGTRLFEALNDAIIQEVKKEGFPFPENPYVITNRQKLSDSKQSDKMVREYLNQVDKALVKIINDSGLQCVVIATQSNYAHLMQVADKPSVYLGNSPINYNDTANHTLASQGWALIRSHQKTRKANAIKEVKEAISQSKVLTDLQEIYRAAKSGRGELLITHQDFSQPVKMINEDSFEMVDNGSQPGIIDDIGSIIAWEVISKKGKAIYTEQDEIKDLGKIVLKLRY